MTAGWSTGREGCTIGQRPSCHRRSCRSLAPCLRPGPVGPGSTVPSVRHLLLSMLLLAGLLAGCTDAPGDASAPGPDAPGATADDAPDAPKASRAMPSPSPTPSPSPAPVQVVDHGDLPERLAAVLSGTPTVPGTALLAAPPEGAEVAVVVVAADGSTVLDVRGDAPMLPASTAKSLTAAAALEVLGPDAVLSTRLEAVGPLDASGVLDGHLRIVGEGDPTLATETYRTHVYASRPASVLEDLAVQARAAGLTAVGGGVWAGPDPLGPERVAPGWRDTYLSDLDARRITGLTVDAGLAVAVLSEPPELQLEILGSPDPTERLRRSVEAALVAEGVQVAPRRLGLPDSPVRTVARLASPPVSEQLRFALERSDNHLADTLLRVVGARRGAPGFAGAGDVVRAELAALGVPVRGVRLRDGSGLSRESRVSARALAELDRIMRAGEHGALWRDLHAVAGVEGTVRRRLRGSVAEGRFVAKTGTLSDVVAVAGTVEGPDGGAAYHVAVLHAGLSGVGSRNAARAVEDELVRLLAEEAAGCERVLPDGGAAQDSAATPPAPASSPAPSPSPPPPEVVCPVVP